MPAPATKSSMDQKHQHPLEDLIRSDRIPHIWCPGCGIGTAFSSCLSAMKAGGRDLEKMCMVSGIGCTGRAAGYVMLDSFHTTHGRAIPFATGLKLGNPTWMWLSSAETGICLPSAEIISSMRPGATWILP
jgi:2-oxoglutarate ferredoxin oxidoreductase subunit beta